MNKIVVKRNDGGVSIIVPTNNISLELIERDALRVEGYVSHRFIEDHHLPSDRIFRNAWTDDNPTETIDIDMIKAVEIHKNKLRELRKPLLEKLDIEFTQALETGNEDAKKLIADKKNALRDVTIQSWPETSDELKNFIPAILIY